MNRSAKSGRVDSLTGGAVTTTLGYETIFGDLTLLETTCTGTTCTQAANCDTNGDCFVEDLTYDALGRIETRTDTVQSSTNPLLTYEYDTQSRLWKVTPTGGSTATYGYDASGNKNGNRTSAPGQSLTYDEQDRISTSGYLHDNDGRLTSPDNGTTTYAYDDFGSLVSATLTGNVEIQYVYDGQRRRVTRKKLVSSVVTEERRYLYAQGNRLVAMYDGSGNLLQQYVYASGRHVPDAVIAGGVLYRIGTDHLGSVRVVVKQSDGTVVQRTEFDAWGELVGTEFVGTGWERMAFGFAGGLRDVDTGLVQMGARWYSPEVGRFITKDPVRFDGGYNLYAYANNDPVNFFDITGLGPGSFLNCVFFSPWMPAWRCVQKELEGIKKGIDDLGKVNFPGGGGVYRETPPRGPEFPECADPTGKTVWMCCRQTCDYWDPIPEPDPMNICPQWPQSVKEQCFDRCIKENFPKGNIW